MFPVSSGADRINSIVKDSLRLFKRETVNFIAGPPLVVLTQIQLTESIFAFMMELTRWRMRNRLRADSGNRIAMCVLKTAHRKGAEKHVGR